MTTEHRICGASTQLSQTKRTGNLGKQGNHIHIGSQSSRKCVCRCSCKVCVIVVCF